MRSAAGGSNWTLGGKKCKLIPVPAAAPAATGLHTASLGTGGLDAGTMGVTRLAPQEARAEQVLGIGLTLQTAPLL